MNAHLVILPFLLPLAGAVGAVLLREHRRWQGWWALGIMLAALTSSLTLLAHVWTTGQPVVFAMGGWAAPFGIVFVGDLLAALMAVMCQLVLSAGLLYALGSRDKCVQYPTFYVFFLTLSTGLTGGMLTGDLFNLFVFAELLVISGAALTAMSDDQYGTEAAYKYFYISTLAGVFLLIANGVLYVSYGTLNMADLARQIAATPTQPLLLAGMVALLVFFMIKSAVVPFHFWQPDFHTAAPTPVSAMLSSVVVKFGVYGFYRMATLLFPSQLASLQVAWLIFGVVGVVYGGLGAAGTHNLKRLLAYSTLGQIGFILVALGSGTPLGLLAGLVFAFNHSLVKSALLMLAGAMASRAPVKTAALDVLTGLGHTVPGAGVLFFVGGLALAGIPPTNGFISKMLVFRSTIEAAAYLPLLFLGLASVVSLIYVARTFMRIWWQPPAAGVKAKPEGDQLWAPALLLTLCLVLGLWAEPLVQLAQATVVWLGNPANYVQAVLGS